MRDFAFAELFELLCCRPLAVLQPHFDFRASGNLRERVLVRLATIFGGPHDDPTGND